MQKELFVDDSVLMKQSLKVVPSEDHIVWCTMRPFIALFFQPKSDMGLVHERSLNILPRWEPQQVVIGRWYSHFEPVVSQFFALFDNIALFLKWYYNLDKHHLQVFDKNHYEIIHGYMPQKLHFHFSLADESVPKLGSIFSSLIYSTMVVLASQYALGKHVRKGDFVIMALVTSETLQIRLVLGRWFFHNISQVMEVHNQVVAHLEILGHSKLGSSLQRGWLETMGTNVNQRWNALALPNPKQIISRQYYNRPHQLPDAMVTYIGGCNLMV